MLYYYCIKPDNAQWGQPATLLGHVPGHMVIRSRQSDSLSKQLSSPIQCTLGQVWIIKLGKLFCVNHMKIFVISLSPVLTDGNCAISDLSAHNCMQIFDDAMRCM